MIHMLFTPQVSVDNVIGDLEDARRSAETDENAVMLLQSQLQTQLTTVAQMRCVRFIV